MQFNTKRDSFYTFLGFLLFLRVFLLKAVLQVGSARSQLFMPGFRHAHTLQLLKSNSDDVYSSSSISSLGFFIWALHMFVVGIDVV